MKSLQNHNDEEDLVYFISDLKRRGYSDKDIIQEVMTEYEMTYQRAYYYTKIVDKP